MVSQFWNTQHKAKYFIFKKCCQVSILKFVYLSISAINNCSIWGNKKRKTPQSAVLRFLGKILLRMILQFPDGTVTVAVDFSDASKTRICKQSQPSLFVCFLNFFFLIRSTQSTRKTGNVLDFPQSHCPAISGSCEC